MPSSPISTTNRAELRRDDRLATLGILAFGFVGVIGLPGVVLTFFYLRQPYGVRNDVSARAGSRRRVVIPDA